MLKIFNTLTGSKDIFKPIEPGKVRMYVCGPTVYADAHVGHAMAAIVFDMVRRYLIYRGYQVHYVTNFTDVDDKIIARAAEEGVPASEVARRYADEYHRDLAGLNMLDPDAEPRVSDHLEPIFALIRSLVDKGLAYAVDGDVYYRVGRFQGYGKLSRRRIEDLKIGARIEVDEAKEDPLDFVLWKAAKPGEPAWDSPWGPGRPGWHIECSVMSTELLGEHFDIHGGGLDLKFPHHENEIAQSEAAHPDKGDFARIWMHNGFVNIDKEKMAKSLGNFVTIADVYERNDPEALRYFLLTVHYRSGLNFEVQVRCPACEAEMDRAGQEILVTADGEGERSEGAASEGDGTRPRGDP